MSRPRLKSEDCVLVVVDVQGKLASLMHEREAFIAGVRKLIQGARILGLPILWNEQIPDKLGPTVPEVRELLGDAEPFVKDTFSCCGSEDFPKALLRLGRRQVLLCGMETHVCVYQTALDLLEAGCDVFTAEDAVSSRTPRDRDAGIAAMRDAGAHPATAEMCLFELMKTARGERFRELIRVVK